MVDFAEIAQQPLTRFYGSGGHDVKEGGLHHAAGFARSTYSSVEVSTMMVSPAGMNGGTMTRTPFSRIAGLYDDAAVWPRTTGSASTIFIATFCGSFTD